MADRKKTKPASRKKGSPPARRKKSRRVRTKSLWLLSRFRRSRAEFREDSTGTGLLKLLHITRLQRLYLLRWGLYIFVCIMALVFQDVIMSRVKLLGATTDLAPAAILLIAVLEGSEVGSVFALLASIVYHFSGTAPGAYCVGLISVLGLLAALFRQKYWHRSTGSIILCATAAVITYEIGLYAAGLFLGLTRWSRILHFLLAGIYSSLVMIPLYQLVYRIGLIGGNIWKE